MKLIRWVLGRIKTRLAICPSDIRLALDQSVRSLHYEYTREWDK